MKVIICTMQNPALCKFQAPPAEYVHVVCQNSGGLENIASRSFALEVLFLLMLKILHLAQVQPPNIHPACRITCWVTCPQSKKGSLLCQSQKVAMNNKPRPPPKVTTGHCQMFQANVLEFFSCSMCWGSFTHACVDCQIHSGDTNSPSSAGSTFCQNYSCLKPSLA